MSAPCETAVLEALCSLAPDFSLPDEPWSASLKTGFLVLGLNSKQMPLLAKHCGRLLGCSVSPMALLEHPTPLELAAHLAELPKSGKAEAASAEAQAAAAKRRASTASDGAPKGATLRVLALHGQYVNATIMQMAMTPLVAAARRRGVKLEIVCPDGPLKSTVRPHAPTGARAHARAARTHTRTPSLPGLLTRSTHRRRARVRASQVSELRGHVPDDPLWSLWGLRDVYRWSAHDDAGGTRQVRNRTGDQTRDHADRSTASL